MSGNIEAALKAALWRAIAELGERATKEIVDEIFSGIANKHYGR